MIALLRAQRVEGMLLVAAGGDKLSPERAASLTTNSPVVCLDRLPADLDVDSVCVDDCGAAEMGNSHLMGMGHTEIAIITGPLTLHNEQERLRGYRQALKKKGIPVNPSLIWPGSFKQDEVARICQKGLIRPTGRPSALFATNGVTGLAALRSLYEVGLSTPEDFAFATFDELTAEEFFKPGITSVIQPTFDMGYRAVEVLLNRIQKETAESPRENVRLPATLMVRDSSKVHHSPAAKNGASPGRKSARSR